MIELVNGVQHQIDRARGQVPGARVNNEHDRLTQGDHVADQIALVERLDDPHEKQVLHYDRAKQPDTDGQTRLRVQSQRSHRG